MKKKITVFIVIALLITAIAVSFSGCNFFARNFGGTMELNLPENQKLVNVTWKEDSLWYLTKPMSDTDVAEDYIFTCDSNFGVFEGTVNIHEATSEK